MSFLVDEFKRKRTVLVTTNEFWFEVGFPGTESMFCVYNFILPLNSVLGYWHILGISFYSIPPFIYPRIHFIASLPFVASLRSMVASLRRTFACILLWLCSSPLFIANRRLFLGKLPGLWFCFF